MKQNDFKVGERVCAYSTACNCVYKITGVVVDISPEIVFIQSDNVKITVTPYHYKQCRRLKKREPRRIWVSKSNLDHSNQFGARDCIFWVKPPGDNYIEFVEVRK